MKNGKWKNNIQKWFSDIFMTSKRHNANLNDIITFKQQKSDMKI